ncbi:MAG: mercuric transporter MerT family protein [Zetaproteobacteria bacterium]|nr:mercuric transporter MerT family protein [Zetaproteobacteria bacterium]
MILGLLQRKSGWMIGGGVLAALVSSFCCVGPLVLTLLGVSGAGVLAHYGFLRIPMMVLVTLLFAGAGWGLWQRRLACTPGTLCASPRVRQTMVICYLLGLLCALAAMSSPYWVVWLFAAAT